MIKLKASWNQLRRMFDFEPPANLEWVDYSGNAINKIENCDKNPYLKYLNLDSNNIQTIEGLNQNRCLRVSHNFIFILNSIVDTFIKWKFNRYN